MNTTKPTEPATHTQGTPRFYALRFCAAQAGMTADSFLQACNRKEIPVTVLRMGERGRWKVDAIEFIAWLGYPPALHSLSKLF
jgi:hypothetical protein